MFGLLGQKLRGADVARHLGVSQSYVSSWRQGSALPSFERAVGLAILLDVELSTLIPEMCAPDNHHDYVHIHKDVGGYKHLVVNMEFENIDDIKDVVRQLRDLGAEVITTSAGID